MNKLYYKAAKCAEQSFFEETAASYHKGGSAYFSSIEKKKGASLRQSKSGFMLLDAILCELGVDRSTVLLKRTESGRPYAEGSDFDFSISHSADVCACAVCFGASVGCDIQELVQAPEEKLVHNARYFMNENELQALSTHNACEYYTACWSKKEAYLKASGLGTDEDLTALEISGAEFEQKRLVVDEKIYYLTICTKKYE